MKPAKRVGISPRGKKVVGVVPHEEELVEGLRNPVEAGEYLKASLSEGGIPLLLKAMMQVADATGGISVLAKKTGLSRQAIYTTLGGKTSPRIETVEKILRTFGLSIGITIRPIG